MYIYRAINSLDEKLNPSEFGLISKEMVNSVIVNDFDFLIYAISIKSGRDLLENLTDADVKSLYRDLRNIFVDNHRVDILRKAEQKQSELNNKLNNIFFNKDEDSFNDIMSIFKKINGHVTNGSKVDYPWISFSTDPKTIKRYYDNQNKNSVVVVDSNIKTSFDICGNDRLLAVDLSNLISINENPFLINNNNYRTAVNYRGYNYARNSKEVIYYNMVPKEKIVTILNSLEYELLINDLLPVPTYYNYSEFHKKYLHILILKELRELFKNDGDIVNYILNEYYDKSDSLKYLSYQKKYELGELKDTNDYMVNKIKTKVNLPIN